MGKNIIVFDKDNKEVVTITQDLKVISDNENLKSLFSAFITDTKLFYIGGETDECILELFTMVEKGTDNYFTSLYEELFNELFLSLSEYTIRIVDNNDAS